MGLKQFEQRVVDGLLVAVGAVATYLSVKYTWQWQVYTGDGKVEALAYASVIVGFATIAFEFAVQAAMEKKRWAWALFVAWLVVSAYSMQTTVAGQWIGVREREASRAGETGEVVQAELEKSVYEEKVKALEERLAGYRTERARIEQLLAGVDTVEKRQEFRRNSTELEKSLQGIRDAEAQVEDELMEARLESARRGVVTVVAKRTGSGQSVFAFYEEVLKIEASKVEFVLAVFKGIILDTVNILCFMFVMIRRGKEGDGVLELSRIQDDGEEEEELPSQGTASSPIERLVEELYRPGRRGRWIGRERAKALGIEDDELERVVLALVKSGTIVRRGGRLWLNQYVSREELWGELSEKGLTASGG